MASVSVIDCVLQQLAARRAVDGQQPKTEGKRTRPEPTGKRGENPAGKGELKEQRDVH
jgi:hypothetical protein